MKGRGMLAGTAAALAVLLVLVFVFPRRMIAPGALMPAHTQLQDDCFACHAPLRGASAARCIACHVPTDIGIRTTKGLPLAKPAAAFHAALQEPDCTACHSDHAASLLSGRHPKSFDHGLLKPATASACATCHARPANALHRGVGDNCALCHRTSGWKPANFAHDRYFALDRDHNAACTTCHIGSVFTRYTCYGCHEHQPAQIAAEHREEGIRDVADCARCHRSAQAEAEGREGED